MFHKMPVVNPEKLIALQRNADEIRNVRHTVLDHEGPSADGRHFRSASLPMS